MSEIESISRMCEDANRIAAQLRGGQPLKMQVRLQPKQKKPRPVRAYATGIPGKGGYLKAGKQALIPELLAYCHEFLAENDQLPPQASVAQRFGVCEQVAQKYIHWLAEAGHIERNAVNRWRLTRRPAP